MTTRVHEMMAKEFDQEWVDLDPRARDDVVVDFRRIVADPEGFDYSYMLSFPELAREYHRNIGQGHLAAYAACLATRIYGRTDTQFDGSAREYLQELAQRHIGVRLTELFIGTPDDAREQLSALKLYHHYADILADGILPECGHMVMHAECDSVQGWLCGHPECWQGLGVNGKPTPMLSLTLAVCRG